VIPIPIPFPNLTLTGILVAIPGVIITVTLHEYAKSLVAYKLGDVNVKTQGRLAPNPLKHMDILGGIFLVVFGYGWASPVRLMPSSFKDRKKAMLLIFIIPFLANIIAGVVFAIAANILEANFTYLLGSFGLDTIVNVWRILRLMAIFNIAFALFSLIPIYPLNGTHLLWALRPTWALKITQHEKILQFALAFIIILGFAGQVFQPLVLTVISALSF
jgi:Zn-dependent protease